ncbi:MAG TPA: hypothetical protein VN843_04790, partial [Anaerolineales bacterium]|nr:hypothetical protein [Anaerolineales bacterium]
MSLLASFLQLTEALLFQPDLSLPRWGGCVDTARVRKRPSMKPIRVLVANRPRLIRELVMATIADQPDIEIVGEIQQESEIESAVDKTNP